MMTRSPASRVYLDLERTRIGSKVELHSVPALEWMHPDEATSHALREWKLESQRAESPLYNTYRDEAMLAHTTVVKALHSEDSPLWAL